LRTPGDAKQISLQQDSSHLLEPMQYRTNPFLNQPQYQPLSYNPFLTKHDSTHTPVPLSESYFLQNSAPRECPPLTILDRERTSRPGFTGSGRNVREPLRYS
jgi:hypothetical protein